MTTQPTTQQLPSIHLQRREKTGSRYAARLRRAGRLPAVLYGRGQPPIPVWVDQHQMLHLLHQHAHILQAVLDGQTQPCLVKDVQWDHLGSQIIHIDLERVDLTQRVTVEVDLILTGEPIGLKEAGAILEHPLSRIEIECLATQIPQAIKVDISHLRVGDTLLVRDLKLPEGVRTTLDPETLVAQVVLVKEEVVEAAPAEAEAAAEPEVIGRKPAEEEETEESAEKKPAEKEKK